MIDAISILFSGGSDSTLAAVHALQRARTVHLLTFPRGFMFCREKPEKLVDEMRARFGAERIVRHIEPIGREYRRCYFDRMPQRLRRYRTFYIPWMCGACKLAMHLRTIAYNQKHGISVTYDGANSASAPVFPDQTTEYIDVAKRLYRDHGMEYDCPVFSIAKTDRELELAGIERTRDTKREHLFYRNQHTCYVGVILHAHARLYYRPMHGVDRMPRLAAQFLEESIAGLVDNHEDGLQ